MSIQGGVETPDDHMPGMTRRRELTGIFESVSYSGDASVLRVRDDRTPITYVLSVTNDDIRAIIEKNLREGEKVSVSIEDTDCCDRHRSSCATALERFSRHEFQLTFSTLGSGLPMHEVAGESEPAIALRGMIVLDKKASASPIGPTVDVILPPEERHNFVNGLCAWAQGKGLRRIITMTTGFNSMTEIKAGVFRVDAPDEEKTIFRRALPLPPQKGML